MSTPCTAREVLTFLYSEARAWKEEIDGETIEGQITYHRVHYITLGDSVLAELLDMVGIDCRIDETSLQALQRASVEDA